MHIFPIEHGISCKEGWYPNGDSAYTEVHTSLSPTYPVHPRRQNSASEFLQYSRVVLCHMEFRNMPIALSFSAQHNPLCSQSFRHFWQRDLPLFSAGFQPCVHCVAYYDNTIELPMHGQAYNPFRLVQAYNVVLTNDVSTWNTYPYTWWLYIPLLALRPDAT